MPYSWILIPLAAAFIGWFSIWVVISLLFRPERPRNILGIRFQGVFPKYQQRLADTVGGLVSRELLSFGDIREKIVHPANIQKIMPLVDEHVDEFLRVKLPKQMPVIGMFIGDKTIAELKAVFTAELEILFPVIMGNYIHNLEEQLDLKKLVTEKLAGFPPRKLEHIFKSAMSKELRMLPLAGAILGFVMGLVQLAILYWL